MSFSKRFLGRSSRIRTLCAATGRGLTLVEMLVVIAIGGVLSSLALPSFSAVVRETRLSTATGSLHSAIFLTRSEAIKRNRRVTLCTSADRDACQPGIGWHAGWILFEDGNGNGVRDAGEVVVSVGMPMPGGVVSTTKQTQPVRNYVSYLPTGQSRALNGGLLMGTITLCSDEKARQIVISASGRPRVVRNAAC